MAVTGSAHGDVACPVEECDEVFHVVFEFPQVSPIRSPGRPGEIVLGMLARETAESRESRIAHLRTHGLHA